MQDTKLIKLKSFIILFTCFGHHVHLQNVKISLSNILELYI